MNDNAKNPAKTLDPTLTSARRAARRLQLGADGSVVTLEDGEPCLDNPSDGGHWDWDMEVESSVFRCRECGGSERVFKEPDGQILCEACLLRGPAQSLPAGEQRPAAPRR
jgi:hypothetical protein